MKSWDSKRTGRFTSSPLFLRLRLPRRDRSTQAVPWTPPSRPDLRALDGRVLLIESALRGEDIVECRVLIDRSGSAFVEEPYSAWSQLRPLLPSEVVPARKETHRSRVWL